MNRLLLLFCCLFSWGVLTAQQTKPLTIGKENILFSKSLNENRILNVYLPSSYSSTKKYPVIYVLDGSKNEDFLHVAGLTQFFNMMFTMPDCIVVGIENVDRRRDFTFAHMDTALGRATPTSGHSAEFIQFIEAELKPFIQSNYSTNDTSMLIGQSLGGLLATQILLEKPQLFQQYFIISPSLWWADGKIKEKLESSLKNCPSKPEFVYVAVGKKEPKMMRKDAKKLKRTLKKFEFNTYFQLMKRESHATILHNSLYRAFEKRYKPLY